MALLLLLVPAVLAQPLAYLFTASNELAGNSVLVSAISSTGELSYINSISTGGVGTSITAVDDTLYSSHSVKVDQQRSLLFVVNAGSNTVSLFSIQPTQALPLTLVDTVSSGFEYPVSIALNTRDAIACVVNTGTTNGVRCYDYSSGTLNVIALWDRNLNIGPELQTPPNGPFNGTGDIVFTPDLNALVIGLRLNFNGSLLVLPIDYSTSTLAATPISVVPQDSKAPYSLSWLNSAGALLVTDPVLAGVSLLNIDSTSGSSDAATTAPYRLPTNIDVSYGALCWSVYSAVTGSWYLIGSFNNGTIAEITVDPTTLTGNYVAAHPSTPNAGALDAVVISLNSSYDVLIILGPDTHVLEAFGLPAAGVVVPYQNSPLPALTAGSISAQGLDYFVLPQTGPVSSALGDPQFVGLRGQSYQIHGIDGAVYSIISDSTIQLNARFTFLEQGRCTAELRAADIPCWSHPGSYFGALTLQTAAGDQLRIVPGTAEAGLAVVELNGRQISVGEQTVGKAHVASESWSPLSLSYITSHSLTLSVSIYTLHITSSDGFLNLQSVSVSSWTALTKELQPHGLLGQSWMRAGEGVQAEEVAEIEGAVDDYAEANNDEWGVSTRFNLFTRSA